MFSRAARHSALEARWLVPCPWTTSIPSRARCFNSTTPIVDGDSISHDLKPPFPLDGSISSTSAPQEPLSSSLSHSKPPESAQAEQQQENIQTPPQARPPPHESLRTLLPLLKAQRAHYVTVHIHARPYLLTVGDALRLPFRMPDVVPGDILRLNRASIIGSRDYTLKGAPYVDENLFECRARVMGVESEPMRVEEKTKRRQRRVKRVKNKQKYTVLKLAELKIKSLEEAGL